MSTASIMTTELDHELSPHTGWTRAHWTDLCDRTLRAVRPYASGDHALIAPPGPASRSGTLSDGLEGFARTFLSAGFRIAGDQTSPEAAEHAEWYARGLVAGTDPGSGEAWPTLTAVNQARVEAASVAIGLHETRDLIWANLTSADQERVVTWLSGAVGQQYPGNNWVWFQNIVEAFLASVGAPTDPGDTERNLAHVDEWYTGNGWYTDGAFDGHQHRAHDYYSGWAMHVFPLWWSRILGPLADPQRVESDRTRLRMYLEQVQHLIGADGAPVYHGRSLTYRFAMLGPFWTGALFDATPLTPGRTRRLASGVLRYFADRGAWDEHDLQPIGWHGAFPAIRQWYSGPGSPYWSAKGFAGLVLPTDHPVWTATEEPLAVEVDDVAQSWPEPGWLVSATRADGVVRLINHGSDHQPEGLLGLDEGIYGRIGYSSTTAPDSGMEAETSPVDSCVALVDDQGRVSHRRPVQRVAQGERWAVSRHRAHWLVGPARDAWQREADPRPDHFEAGPWITMASVVHGPVEVRVIRLDHDDDPTGWPRMDRDDHRPDRADGPWHWRVGGYALADAHPPLVALSAEGLAPSAEVSTARMESRVAGLAGRWTPGVHRSQGSNAFGTHAAVPLLTGTDPVTNGELTAAAVVLDGSGEPPELPSIVRADDAAGCAITVTWPDGASDQLRLDPPDRGEQE